jgi:putative oxidoreductase
MNAVDTGLLLLRIVVGCTFAAHGFNKFYGGGRIPGTARWFDSIGMRPGRLHAVAAASTEAGAGLLLAFGLLTPFAGAALVAVMLVAAWTVHRQSGFFSAAGGWEYNAVLAVVGVTMAITGPGRASLDHAAGIEITGLTGATIAVVLGLASGIGQLATFYRPVAKIPS